MFFETRFCPRTLRDIPFTGHRPSSWWHLRYSFRFGCWYFKEPRHWCVDCWLMLAGRTVRLWLKRLAEH